MPDGTATAIVWEIAEYVAFIRNSTEFEMAYINRLGNLTVVKKDAPIHVKRLYRVFGRASG